MRNTSSLVGSVALVVSLAACGGKIAPDGRSSSGGDPSANGATGSGPGVSFPPPAPSSSDQPSSPFASPPSSSSSTGGLGQPGATPAVDDACAAICERNAQCGADTPDCKDTCASEISRASTCAAQANAYIQCYASNLASGCAELPPVCEGAYCAYTICAGKVVPDYCGSR